MNPIRKAESIVSLLDINSPSDIEIELIANYFDINIKTKKLDGASARLLCLGKFATITVSNNEKYTPRIRFSIAHELGHFFLHKNKNNFFSCSHSNMYEWAAVNIETEANIFASNLLMPKHLFKEYIKLKDHNTNLVIDASNEFCTSISATLIRIIECSREPCALVCLKDKKIVWSKKNKDFVFRIKPSGEPVADHSYALDCFCFMKSNAGGKAPVYAWIEDSRVDEDAMIIESSFFSQTLNTVFSLLWIDSDIEKSR